MKGDILELIQSRVKYSRLYQYKKIKRLYIPYGQNSRGIKTSAWFEIVNDKLKVFVNVENYRSNNLFDENRASMYLEEIYKQYFELINFCELKRQKTPLDVRLRDDITPIYTDSLKHQADALRFCCTMKVSALYADTGTGKSKIAIDLAISRYEAGQIKKVLVLLPVSTKKNFLKQIDKWSRCLDLQWRIVGEESVGSSDNTYLKTLDYVDNETFIIVDESHMIKTPTAKRSKRIKAISEKTSYKIVMTGTPVTDNIHNLYMQYAVLSPDIIGVRDWKKFEEKYLIMGGRLGDEIVGYKNVDHLMGLLEPYTYQITKDECLDLPAKENLCHTCSLSQEQQFYYEQEKERLLNIIKSDDFNATDIFKTFTHMQQICSGYYKENHLFSKLESNKLSLFKSVNTDNKLVIFCKYLFEVDTIASYFGYDRCAIFTGENARTRDEELSDFVSGRKQFFIATMQSGGTGLNGLQDVCNEMVFFSNSFSYFHRKQSVGRIDRQGQTKKMIIHDFRTDAKIDDRILNNLKRKSNLADEIKEIMLDKTKLKKYVSEL